VSASPQQPSISRAEAASVEAAPAVAGLPATRDEADVQRNCRSEHFSPRPPSGPAHTLGAAPEDATVALDPIRSLGAHLWATELAPFRNGRHRYQVEGWISDWRRRAGEDSTSVGFSFELETGRSDDSIQLVHGQVRPIADATTIWRVPRAVWT